MVLDGDMMSGKPPTRGVLDSAASAMKILLTERRIPGPVYRTIFQTLDKFGIDKVTVRHKGLRVTGYTHSIWEYFIIRDKKEYDIVGQDFKPGMTVIDIGANQGFFTLYAASKGARVISFEPSKTNFAMLSRNVEQNGLNASVKCFDCAVSGASGTTTIFEGLSSSGRFLSTTASIRDSNRGGADVRSAVTNTVTLDEVFQNNGIEFCDLLKLDCEGSEYDIIPTISSETFRRIRNISMEYHDGRLDEMNGWLARGGFDIVSVRGGNVGLLKARNKSVVRGL